MAWQKISFYSALSCSIRHLELLSNQMAAFLSAILNSCPITGQAALLNYCPIWWLLSICHLEFLSNQRQFAPQPPPWHRTLTSTLLLGTRSLPQWVRYPLARTGVPHPPCKPSYGQDWGTSHSKVWGRLPPSPPPGQVTLCGTFLAVFHRKTFLYVIFFGRIGTTFGLYPGLAVMDPGFLKLTEFGMGQVLTSPPMPVQLWANHHRRWRF